MWTDTVCASMFDPLLLTGIRKTSQVNRRKHCLSFVKSMCIPRYCDTTHVRQKHLTKGLYDNQLILVLACSVYFCSFCVFLASRIILSQRLRSSTPYASGRQICEQKLRNVYQRKKNREINYAFQMHLYHWVHQTIQQNIVFANNAHFPFTVIVHVLYASCSLRPSPAFCHPWRPSDRSWGGQETGASRIRWRRG